MTRHVTRLIDFCCHNQISLLFFTSFFPLGSITSQSHVTLLQPADDVTQSRDSASPVTVATNDAMCISEDTSSGFVVIDHANEDENIAQVTLSLHLHLICIFA